MNQFKEKLDYLMICHPIQFWHLFFHPHLTHRKNFNRIICLPLYDPIHLWEGSYDIAFLKPLR
jgi:hypothetical protein